MAVLNFFEDPAADVVMDAVKLRVFDLTDGNRELTELTCLSLSQSIGSTPSQATFALRSADISRSATAEDSRMEQVFNAADGYTVFDKYLEHDVIVMTREALDWEDEDDLHYWPMWQGTITNVVPAFNDDAEGVQLIAQDYRWKMNNLKVRGQWADLGDTAATVSHVDTLCVMNPLGEGNASSRDYAFANPQQRTSTNAWTLSDAIAYFAQRYRHLTYEGVGMEATAYPIFELVADLADEGNEINLPTLKLEGLTVGRALDAICSAAKHTWWLTPPERGVAEVDATYDPLPLLHIEPLQRATSYPIRLPVAGTESVDRKLAWPQAGQASLGIADSVNQPTLLGQHREYEATWVLMRGWTSADQATVDATPTKGSRDSTDYVPGLDPVYRQWVLNEDREYSTQAYADYVSDGDTGTSQCTVVFVTNGSESYVQHRRRVFGSCYHKPEDKPRNISVWFKSAGTGSDWAKAGSGAVRLMPDRCGIIFDTNAIDASDGHSYVRGTFSADDVAIKVAPNEITDVKVCAIVRSDYRCASTATRGDDAAARHTIEAVVHDNTFREVWRDTTSEYSGDGTGRILDPSDDMDALSEKVQESVQNAACSASFVIPWIDAGFHLNDRIDGLDEPQGTTNADGDDVLGRGISFQTNRAADSTREYPRVVAVRWDYAGQQTEVLLTDTREGHF